MGTHYNILAVSGSLRARSSNTEALRAAARLAPASARVTIFDGLGALPHFKVRARATFQTFPNASHGFLVVTPRGAPWDWPRLATGFHELMADWIGSDRSEAMTALTTTNPTRN